MRQKRKEAGPGGIRIDIVLSIAVPGDRAEPLSADFALLKAGVEKKCW